LYQSIAIIIPVHPKAVPGKKGEDGDSRHRMTGICRIHLLYFPVAACRSGDKRQTDTKKKIFTLQYFARKGLAMLISLAVLSITRIVTCGKGHVPAYQKMYQLSTAVMVAEQARISKIVAVLSFFCIAVQSRFCFFAINPINNPVPVPASMPRERIIRKSSRVAVMQMLQSGFSAIGYKLLQ
jgi:hypothetical protein